jgi:hypothetical protein
VSLLGTAAAWLVEPADEPATDAPAADAPLVTPPRSAEAPLSRLAVLGSPAHVPALAAAVALAARARAHVPAALIALWRAPGDEGSPPGPAAPALPGAVALAARLSRRDLPVVARGRLAWLLLPPEGEVAVPMLRRAEAAAGDLPAVLALARARDATADRLLAERELLVVAAAPGSALASAAAEDAIALRAPVHPCAPLPAGVARLAALAGIRAPRLDIWATATATAAAKAAATTTTVRQLPRPTTHPTARGHASDRSPRPHDPVHEEAW